MTPERWREVKAVVGEALDRPTGERAALLARACGADAELRWEAESLLAHARGGADPDSVPAMRAAVASAAAALGAGGGAGADPVLRPLLEHALGGQYDIVRPLGSGGMGAVYLAWERALDRPVAIKVLRPDLAEASAGRERFRREARTVAQLSHPGIVPLYSFGEVRGLWYFVMGYVRGASLAEHLRLRGRLPWGEARRILADLADALACAHRHGVVHRDIKPANVLLDEESGRAVLADFGISKLQGGGDVLTAADAVVGTPRYMSPEQARGAPDVDERSDIYSLGAVAYTMLAGREPFVGGNAEDVMARRLTDEPTALRRIAPAVPEDLAAVVSRCLERDRALRWPDARGLKAALERTGDGATAATEALADVSGFGPYALVWALAWSALAALTAPSPGDAGWLVLVALVVPLGLALHVWHVERRELTPAELARLAFHPPRWWGMWWPVPLRRPGDLWPHLPWQARFVRRGLSACVVALPLLVLAQRRGAAGGSTAYDWALRYGPAAEWGVALCAAVLTGGALAWSRVQGLTAREATQLLFGATMPSSAWRTPNVAHLLGPASHDVRPPERDDAADHARAVAELTRLLPPEVGRVGADAADVAHRVAAAVAHSDRELGALARDAGAAEIDRLATRLTALEDASACDGDGDVGELRELVRRQLDVLHRMRRRHETLSHRRTRLLDLARGIWTQLYALHDTTSGAPERRDETVARLRALCAEAAAVVEASRPAAAATR